MRIETKQNEGKTSIKRELEDQIERAKVTSAKCDSKYSTDMEIIKVRKTSIRATTKLTLFHSIRIGLAPSSLGAENFQFSYEYFQQGWLR